MAKRRMLKKKINDIIDIAAGLCLIEAARASGEKRKEYGKVGVSSAVRLNIRVLCAEQLAGALLSETLHLVYIHAASVVSLCGVALSIFICEYASCGEEHTLRNNVFRCDELDVVALSLELALTGGGYLRVKVFKIFKKHDNLSFIY